MGAAILNFKKGRLTRNFSIGEELVDFSELLLRVCAKLGLCLCTCMNMVTFGETGNSLQNRGNVCSIVEGQKESAEYMLYGGLCRSCNVCRT